MSDPSSSSSSRGVKRLATSLEQAAPISDTPSFNVSGESVNLLGTLTCAMGDTLMHTCGGYGPHEVSGDIVQLFGDRDHKSQDTPFQQGLRSGAPLFQAFLYTINTVNTKETNKVALFNAVSPSDHVLPPVDNVLDPPTQFYVDLLLHNSDSKAAREYHRTGFGDVNLLIQVDPTKEKMLPLILNSFPDIQTNVLVINKRLLANQLMNASNNAGLLDHPAFWAVPTEDGDWVIHPAKFSIRSKADGTRWVVIERLGMMLGGHGGVGEEHTADPGKSTCAVMAGWAMNEKSAVPSNFLTQVLLRAYAEAKVKGKMCRRHVIDGRCLLTVKGTEGVDMNTKDLDLKDQPAIYGRFVDNVNEGGWEYGEGAEDIMWMQTIHSADNDSSIISGGKKKSKKVKYDNEKAK